MGLFDFLKPRKQPIRMHLINAKIKKGIENLYVDQFVSIEADIGTNDNINYYFQIFENCSYTRISNKISAKEEEYCESYSYGVIHSISNGNIEVALICAKGFLKVLAIETSMQTSPGDAFTIKDSKLYDNNKLVGTITNEKGLDLSKARLNSVDKEGNLVVFFEK